MWRISQNKQNKEHNREKEDRHCEHKKVAPIDSLSFWENLKVNNNAKDLMDNYLEKKCACGQSS